MWIEWKKIALSAIFLAVVLTSCALQIKEQKTAVQKTAVQKTAVQKTASETANSKINSIKNDIYKLKNNSQNADLDKLLREANEIGIMNDRCGSISITEKTDEACRDFYRVTLPNFEKKYTKVTGEIRLGSLQDQKKFKDWGEAAKACVDALKPFFYINPILFFKKDYHENMIPLDFEGKAVEYTLTTYFNRDFEFIKNVQKQAEAWNKTCLPVVKGKDKYGNEIFLPPIISKLGARGYYENSISMYCYRDVGEPLRCHTSGWDWKHFTFAWHTLKTPHTNLLVNGKQVGKKNIDDYILYLSISEGLFVGIPSKDSFNYEAIIDLSKALKIYWIDND